MSQLPRAFEAYRPLVESALEEIFAGRNRNPLEGSMAYSSLAGGKRLRPVLAMCGYSVSGGKDPRAVATAACALELFHTYSLIHDDLPAMDDDDLRRGSPTNHKVYGEAMAILAGDALQSLAAEILSTHPKGTPFRSKRLKVLRMVLSAVGREGMALGQAIDIMEKKEGFGEPELLRMHRLKTGRLLEASLLSGAVWAGADRKMLGLLSDYARPLGIAFQLSDDILDEVSTADKLGKTPGKDRRDNKTTLTTLWGLDKSRKMLEHYLSESLRALAPLGNGARDLREIARFVAKRDF